MSTLEAKMREFAAGHQKPFDKADWDQMCGSLMFRFNDWLGWQEYPGGDISSARRAAMGSGLLNQDASACPVGGFHFFDIAGINNGHVGMDASGGGRDVFMATWSVTEDLGRAIGFLSVDGYLKAKAGRVKYLGWATSYSGGTVDLGGYAAAVASEAITLLANVAAAIELQEDTLKVYANSEAPQAWAVGGSGTWREIPEGYAGDAIAAFGPVVKLSNVAFDLARKICNREPYGA